MTCEILVPINELSVFEEPLNSYSLQSYTDFQEAHELIKTKVTAGLTRIVLLASNGYEACIKLNKNALIRAALVTEELSAYLSVNHNNANVLIVPTSLVGVAYIPTIINTFIQASFDIAHLRRVDMLSNNISSLNPRNLSCESADKTTDDLENKTAIVLSSDHAGLELRSHITLFLKTKYPYLKVIDVGPTSKESVDYPVYAFKGVKTWLTQAVQAKKSKLILVCGSGLGIMMAANRVTDVKALVCSTPYQVKLATTILQMNTLVLGQRVIGIKMAEAVVEQFVRSCSQSSQ